MNRNKKIILKGLIVQRDQQWWIVADLEFLNISVNDPHRKTLYMNKPTGIGYKILGKPYHGNTR